MKTILITILTTVTIVSSCTLSGNDHVSDKKSDFRPRAKFEPEDGEVILFVGQELEAIGGLEEYNDGYLDHFDTPAGFTMYTNLAPGDTSFGYVHKGLDGIYSKDDWGDSPSYLNLQLADPDFENMALAIGLSLVNHEEHVASGARDSLVIALGKWIDDLGDRPVFLRIGYEFDGHAWNFYESEPYKAAYRRIKDKYDSMGIDNIAYVWQSVGWVSTPEYLEQWYPGDDYVDWCAYSFFDRYKEQEMIDFARAKGKPVFIAESSPTISSATSKFDGKTKETILSNPEQAREAWDKWFIPYFKCINENPDVVKAISYINCEWKSHRMWYKNPTFQDVDARLQTSEYISEKWVKETSKPKYLKASPDLFKKLSQQQVKL